MAGYSTPAWVNGTSPAINAANLTALGQAAELGEHPYGVCSTAAATKAKTVTIDYSGTLSLFTGLTVRVKFSNGNSAAAPTLNVNSTGAKAIKSYGTTAATTWVAGQIIEFIYDGTYWLFDGIDAYTKAQSLSDATASAINSLTGTTPTTPDEALAQLATAAASNLRMASGSYTGSGTSGSSNKNALTFTFAPKLLIVWHGASSPNGLQPDLNYSYWHYSFIWTTGQTQAGVYAGSTGVVNFTVSGKTIRWYSSNSAAQLNAIGTTYNYFALGI